MSPFYLNQVSTMAVPERDEDQSHLPTPFTTANDTSYSYPILFHTRQDDQRIRDHHHLQQQQEEVNQQFFISGLSNSAAADENNNDLKLSLCNQYVREEDQVQESDKWMSSKMRFMRKMMNSDRTIPSNSRSSSQVVLQDQTQPSQDLSSRNESSPPSGIIRVCSDCNTTKTPLWRSGPCGPKSLCNACGIRRRKARRVMAAAAAASGGGLVPTHAPAKVKKEKKLDADRSVPFKKRCKFTSAGSTTTQKKLCFEDDHISLSLSTNSSFHQVFPQDERDAAILLMALSYGLIRS